MGRQEFRALRDYRVRKEFVAHQDPLVNPEKPVHLAAVVREGIGVLEVNLVHQDLSVRLARKDNVVNPENAVH